MVPEDLLYTEQHEWIRLADGVGTVGLTDYAQKALGDITFVELPSSGAELAKGEEACAIESCKAAASIYAVVGGTITDSNAALDAAPALVNGDCYGEGWIYKISISDETELSQLMTPQQYEEFLAGQE